MADPHSKRTSPTVQVSLQPPLLALNGISSRTLRKLARRLEKVHHTLAGLSVIMEAKEHAFAKGGCPYRINGGDGTILCSVRGRMGGVAHDFCPESFKVIVGDEDDSEL